MALPRTAPVLSYLQSSPSTSMGSTELPGLGQCSPGLPLAPLAGVPLSFSINGVSCRTGISAPTAGYPRSFRDCGTRRGTNGTTAMASFIPPASHEALSNCLDNAITLEYQEGPSLRDPATQHLFRLPLSILLTRPLVHYRQHWFHSIQQA